MTATIKPHEAQDIAAAMEGSGIHLIGSPVFGGYPGAQSGTLTLMAAAPSTVLDKFAQVMEAVSGTIHRIGEDAGMGQTINACLQTLIGSIFSATFEASVLAVKAGVKGEYLLRIFQPVVPARAAPTPHLRILLTENLQILVAELEPCIKT